MVTTANLRAAIPDLFPDNLAGGIDAKDTRDALNLVADAIDDMLALKAPLLSPEFSGNVRAPTPGAGTSSEQVATTAFVAAALSALIGGATPETLDTLKEIADALGEDPNFAATIAAQIAQKAPLNSPEFTGTPNAPTPATSVNSTRIATTAFVQALFASFRAVESRILLDIVDMSGTGQAMVGAVRSTQQNLTVALGTRIQFYSPGTNTDVNPTLQFGGETYTIKSRLNTNLNAGDIQAGRRYDAVVGGLSPRILLLMDSVRKEDVQLDQVDNTPDAEKEVSQPQQEALDEKADKDKTVSGTGLAKGSMTLDENPEVEVTAATKEEMSFGKSSETVVTPERLAELLEAFFGKVTNAEEILFDFGGLGYFDKTGAFHAQIADPIGAYALSDTYEFAETDGMGRVIRARTWDGLDYEPGSPAQGYGLSDQYSMVEMAPDGSLLRGQRWDGTSRDEGNGPFILDNLWAEQSETGALLRRMRMDRTFAIGPTHRIEWTAYVDGDVYLVAVGRIPFRVTLDAGTTYTYLSAKMEGLRLEIVRKAVAGGAVDKIVYALPGAVIVPGDVDLIDHLLTTGQSLSIGASTNGIITPTNPDPKLLMFNGGVKTLGGFHQISQRDHVLLPDRLTSLVPAFEVAVGGQGETPTTRMGAAYRATLPAESAVLVSAHGIGSVPHSALERGGQIYANSLEAVFWARLVAGVAGLDYRCKYVSDIQGEGNIGNSAAQRVSDLIRLQEQYTEDINALTGQVGEVVLVQCQTSNATMYGYTMLPGMPEGQLQVAIDNPTKHICPGPKYWCEYSDGTHLTAEYSAKMGEVHGYHIARFEADLDASPLYPETAAIADGKLTITFHVPDDATWEVNTSLVTDPGNWGVTFHDDGDGNTITISNGDSPSAGVVTYDVSAVPTGSNPRVGIAVTGNAAAPAGRTTGMRSNFCAVTGRNHYDGTPIRLWSAHRIIPVTL